MSTDTQHPGESTGAVLEADDGNFSGYETTGTQGTDTTSLASSLNEYIHENGRRYHSYYGPDKNLMPTDEIEQQRLDIHHEILLLIADNKLYHAPVEQTHRVLDMGTGTGIWSVDYAVEHTEAEVTGLDLSPIQPNWVPPNCRFEVDDFELEWTYKPDWFDFIHARNIAHSVKDWSNVLPQVFRHLKPGGWFELAEIGAEVFSDDNTIPEDWPPKVALDYGRQALEKLGRTIPTAEWLEQHLKSCGLVDVTVKTFKHPVSPWPKHPDMKQAGALFASAAEETYLSYDLSLLTRVHGMSVEEARALCAAAGRACLDQKSGVHAYFKYFVGYGRKPE